MHSNKSCTIPIVPVERHWVNICCLHYNSNLCYKSDIKLWFLRTCHSISDLMAQFPWGRFALFTAGCKPDSSPPSYHHLTELIIFFFGWLHPDYSLTWYPDLGVKFLENFCTFSCWEPPRVCIIRLRLLRAFYNGHQWWVEAIRWWKVRFLQRFLVATPAIPKVFALRGWTRAFNDLIMYFSLCSDLEAWSSSLFYLCAFSILHVWGSDGSCCSFLSSDNSFRRTIIQCQLTFPLVLASITFFLLYFYVELRTLSFFPSFMPHGLEILHVQEGSLSIF